MKTQEAIELLKTSSLVRYTYFEESFFEFCKFYFMEYYSFDTPDCLLRYYEALEQGKNVYFKGFRWSAKTTIAQMYVSWCIAYKKRRNIMRYSQTIDNAEENLTYISNSFIWDTDGGERFIRDFWNLYYPDFIIKQGQKKIKRIDKFVTENNCYVRAMSLGTSPRWKNYTAPDWKFRPDLLVFDDVDTIASTQSRKMVDKNFEFILNEVLGWTTSNTQILFLWNTIYEDWLVPRFEEHIKNDKDREVIILPIKYQDNHIVRDRFVETDEEAEKKNKDIKDNNRKYISLESEKRRLWSISYNQNYLLIPYTRGEHIITRDMIQYSDYSWPFDKIQIGVDPAISEKEGTDRFWITVVWFKGEKRYILESIGLEGQEKNPKRASEIVGQLYIKYKANRVIVETVAFQQIMKQIFRGLGMATEETKTHKDKVTRLMEKQILFEDKRIYFKPETTTELVDELLEFPDGVHDDYIDSMLFWLYEREKKFFISSL